MRSRSSAGTFLLLLTARASQFEVTTSSRRSCSLVLPILPSNNLFTLQHLLPLSFSSSLLLFPALLGYSLSVSSGKVTVEDGMTILFRRCGTPARVDLGLQTFYLYVSLMRRKPAWVRQARRPVCSTFLERFLASSVEDEEWRVHGRELFQIAIRICC